MQRRNQPADMISKEDCRHAIAEAMSSIESRMDVSNQNFMRGILKFADRVQRMPTSKLTSYFHTFGAAGVTQSRVTITSIVRRAKRGKIHVQPEVVKRRKLESGSRAKQPKGQISKKNPFLLKAGKAKRLHQFAHNVRQNQPVSKKAGRSMSTKTRCCESTDICD
ncbi:Hypothetical predicted protein [Paramuricea clavata]|uniref:Uncharacterized protein n=1 Tax=Paramuricea clavata TaxID=317549 RepID=A0A6S7JNJ7_PARCT|nr:Hypothetical predicted protein [Paramuricea clavata]